MIGNLLLDLGSGGVGGSTDPTKTNCFFTVRAADMSKRAGVTFQFILKNPLAITDGWSTSQVQTATSDVNGLLQINLAINTKWKMIGPDGEHVTFVTGNQPTNPLPEYVGAF